MRPLCSCLSIVSIKVVFALFISLASLISFGSSAGCVARKFFVKLGAPFSVLSYGNFCESNAFAIDAAAHISTSNPAILFISSNNFFSVSCSSALTDIAFCTSTRTPLNFISTRHGKRLVSKLNISHRSCFDISCCSACHSFSVISASFSAYSPTKGAGNFHISAFGLTPKSFAASCNNFSFLRMPM